MREMKINRNIDDKEQQNDADYRVSSFSVNTWSFHIIAIVNTGIAQAFLLLGRVPVAFFSQA